MSGFERKSIELLPLESDLIRRHAKGEVELKDQLYVIYRANIAAHIDSGRGSDEMNYLSEVFNVCPDGVLKKIYRERILK